MEDKANKQLNIDLFLARPDKTTVGKLKHVKDKVLHVKEKEVSDLSFTLPYYISINNKQVKNPHIDKVKEKFLVRIEFRGKKEWFLINNIKKISDVSEDLQVSCFSLEHQLWHHLMIDYDVIGRNCIEATGDVLRGTDWKVGYVNPSFNTKYRKFDIAQSTKLDSIYEIRDTFDSVVVFDTEDKTVNHYTRNELSVYKGFNIGYGKYIQNIEEDIKADEIVTRLYVYGSDGLTINSINPTGQPYIDDFSYFLYPFDMDEDGAVISHSEYMSDSLAKALVKYNKFITENKDSFSDLLEQKTSAQKDATEEINTLVELESELQIILDRITIAKNNGESTSKLNSEKRSKNKRIADVKSTIKKLEEQVSDIDAEMKGLQTSLKLDSHLDEDQIDELSNFIQMDDWTDENQFDPNDLYDAGAEQMVEVNKPPVDISTNIVNFLRMVGEKHNWDRFDVGDIIRIKHDRLGVDLKASLSEITYDFESESISINVTDDDNTTRDLSIEEMFVDSHYTVGKVETDYNKRKINWNDMAYNFNIRNDRFTETPANPTNAVIKHKSNDDGSVDLVLSWNYPEYQKTNKREDNIDGFIIYMYSDGTDEPYQFTSQMSEETLIPNISQDKRAYTIPSVPSNLFYTIGVRAYRRVDDDISRDGILMSEIVGFGEVVSNFRSASSMVATVAMSDEDNPYKSYQPSTEINLRARLNGAKILTSTDKPTNPEEGDIWIDQNSRKVWLWKDGKWLSDVEFDLIRDELEERNREHEKWQDELKKELEKAQKEIDEAMEHVESEMERIETEVVPEVERAVEDTKIPDNDSPPDDIPSSGLWRDTSEDPPRLMRWDDEKGEWVPLAPNEKEIEDIIKKEQDAARVEERRYSNFEILKTRKAITDQLHDEIGDVHGKIEDLEDMAEELEKRADEAIKSAEDLIKEVEEWGDLAEIVDSHSSAIEKTDKLIKQTVEKVETTEDRVTKAETSLEETAEKVALSATKKEVEHIEGEMQKVSDKYAELVVTAEEIKSEVGEMEVDLNGRIKENTTAITQTAESITAKLESFETDYDKDKTDILNSIENNTSEIDAMADKIELRVTKEEFENGMANISTANQITSLEKNWEQGGYDVNADPIDNDSLEAIRLKKSALISLSANTEHTLSSEFIEQQISVGKVGKLSIWGVKTNSDYSSKYVRLVNKVEFNKDGAVTFETGDPTYENAPDVADDNCYILLDIQADFSFPQMEKLDSLRLMLNKGSTARPYQIHDPDIVERMASTEATIKVHADSIEQKAEKSELTNFVDKQVYNEKVGSLETSIDGITGTVKDISADVDKNTGDITSASSKIGELEVTAENITSTVSDIEGDVTKANQAISKVEQQAGKIESTVSNVQTDLADTDKGMKANETRIKQLPDEIDLAVSEGIDGIEVGGRNLISSLAENWSGIDKEVISDNHFITSNPKNTTWGRNQSQTYTAKDGETLTIGADIIDFEGDIIMQLRDIGDNTAPLSHRLKDSDKGKRVVRTWTNNLGKDTDIKVWLTVYGDSQGNDGQQFIEVRNIQLEKGNKATDWSLAEEDRVNKTNVLSSINLSKEGIKIEAPKVDIKGLVSFINEDGSTGTMINGGRIVTSSITADELNINKIFGNSAVIAKIQADSVKTASLDAGKISTGTLKAARIGAKSISASKLAANAVTAEKIAANAVTAKKISVDNLSALTANLGEVNAGKIKGVEVEGIKGTFSTVSVNEGDITFRDVSSSTPYSLISRRNLVKDHSFELVPADFDQLKGTSIKYNWIEVHANDLNKRPSVSPWKVSGTVMKATQYGPSSSDGLAIFGNSAVAVRKGSYIRQYIGEGVGSGDTLTLSAHFKRQWNVKGGGTPRMEVWHVDAMDGDRLTKVADKTFPAVKDDYTYERHAVTFKVPNSFDLGDSIEIVFLTGNSYWVQCDGVQLVEGSVPTDYDPEDAIWDIMSGYYIPSNEMRTLWAGQRYPNESKSHDIFPAKKLTECSNGWAIQWQSYTKGSGLNQHNFQYTYVPKTFDYSNGRGLRVLLAHGWSNEVRKYLYIHEDKISGIDDNSKDNNHKLVISEVFEW